MSDAGSARGEARQHGIPAFADRLAGAIATAATAGLLLLAAAISVDVCLRYFFASPIRGFFDVQPLAFAVLLAACMPFGLTRRSHIAVTLLGEWVGGVLGRALDLFGRMLTLAFFGVMAWQYLRFAFEMHMTSQTMAVLRWPVWPWWAAVAILIVVATLMAAITLMRARPVR